ncbi:U32 family peptidase [Ruminococcaceae bacterium OttesenSCG-928-I18]|nr:U32 family peptidase [Ruminococcaceae bacterium OttesenSCG-928-I18]
MRSSSENFDEEQLFAAAELCHSRGKKLFCTLNTLPTCKEIEEMPSFITMAFRAGVDAFIIADLGVLDLVKRFAPAAEIHFSTQAGIANQAAATMAYHLGAKRVILARELSLEEISHIRKNTPPQLELEAFVHGAMCMSVSGRCLISNYLTGRDANRGLCAQSCRWKYSLLEEQRPGQQFELGEEEYGSYILSADDLCAAPFLDRVLQAGVSSVKVEGRSKSFYYTASVTAAYRAALDAIATAGAQNYEMPRFTAEELEKTSHRPYSSGFFLGRQGATQSPKQGGYLRSWQLVGVVSRQEEGLLHCVQRGKFTLGEPLEALLPEGRAVCFTPEFIKDREGREISATPHTKMEFLLAAPAGESFPANTILRKKL